ncbi:histidinol-phosphatase [Pyrenophora seminiperda CCB06]|uniref:Histidinol-phosphatase n=1 Tax=Pyrenophora seminiperda CCB06 TaxID=1302712 RepID=A0A3M7MFZ1_9PLEO|nr:histidinol-phosphatase [Pyrenophora seminiperda CCB06]
MPHSGQFCGHATNTLEEVIQAAIAKGFQTFALTEHIPRPIEDFYPGEEKSHTARDKAGGTDEQLFQDYFDSQFEMLQALRPPVVGHFDLIRLLSDHRDADFKGMVGVWSKIQRNLGYISSYGGLLELNSSGLRKGLAEPYPCLPICQMFLGMGGGFVMSDDSHGIEQIGTNYARLLAFVDKAGIGRIHFADRAGIGKDSRFPNTGFSSIDVTDLVQLPFWSNLN